MGLKIVKSCSYGALSKFPIHLLIVRFLLMTLLQFSGGSTLEQGVQLHPQFFRARTATAFTIGSSFIDADNRLLCTACHHVTDSP